MKFKCKECGFVIEYEDDSTKEALWRHYKIEHPDIFKNVQDLQTPYFVEDCYEFEIGGNMKTLFISCPMRGRKVEDIKYTFECMHKIAEVMFNQKLDLINPYTPLEDTLPKDVKNKKIFAMANGISKMAKADYYIGFYGLDYYTGCGIENEIAGEYLGRDKTIFLYAEDCHFLNNKEDSDI